jgi:hypothetical protein
VAKVAVRTTAAAETEDVIDGTVVMEAKIVTEEDYRTIVIQPISQRRSYKL